MNTLEKAYSELLDTMKEQGDIIGWDYEPERLVLAKRTSYTPDFRVMTKDGYIEFHEVKGFWEDDARVKIKVAARMHPYTFVACKRLPKKDGGGWVYERFSGS